MYMVDTDVDTNKSFGYTNEEGRIEGVYFEEERLKLTDGVGYFFIYPRDIHHLIKALQHMQKYLIDEGIIK